MKDFSEFNGRYQSDLTDAGFDTLAVRADKFVLMSVSIQKLSSRLAVMYLTRPQRQLRVFLAKCRVTSTHAT